MNSTDQSSPLVLVWKILNRAERRHFLVLLCVLLAGTILEIVSFSALIPAMTVLVNGEVGGRWVLIARFLEGKSDFRIALEVMLTLSILYIVKSCYMAWSVWFQRGFARRIELRLATSLTRQYLSKPYEFHLDNHSSVLVRNIGASGQFVALGIDSLLVLGTDGALLAAVLGLLLVVEPIGSLVALTTLGFLGFAFHSATRKRIERWGYRRTHLEAKRLQYLQEGFGAIKELKALETEEYFASRIESELGETTSLSRKFVTLSSLPRIWLELLAFIGLAFLIIILTARGETLVNSLPILTVFTAAAFRLMPLVNRIIFAVQNLRFGRAAAEILRAEPIDQVESNQYHVNKIRSMKSHIELDDVTYVYPSAFSPVVEKASLFIPKGEIVGIIGESGSGKSTIANLILGLLQPTSGSVKIDGRDVDKSEIPIGRLIGYVPQSIFMIDETIRKNIAFGVSDEDIDEMRIESAIKQSSLTDVISQLPAGLDTKVGEDGAKLSGGQLQRIGIARALYNNPSVLLLDEATSSLDPFTESEIIEELRSMKGAKTVILITHRASTLSICDVIYRMEFGRLHRTGENSRI